MQFACAQWLCRRAGFQVSVGCIFSWSVLAVTAIMGGRIGAIRARAGAQCKPILLPGVMVVAAWPGARPGSECLKL